MLHVACSDLSHAQTYCMLRHIARNTLFSLKYFKYTRITKVKAGFHLVATVS